MARSYKRDKIGRFASTGSASYGNKSDRSSDERWAKREKTKLNKEKKELESKIQKLQQKQPLSKVAAAESGLKAARAKKAEATKKLEASKARLADLKAQLAASQARLGGKSATKRGARR